MSCFTIWDGGCQDRDIAILFFADWLDNGNNKKALQEAERVLKKQPDLQCAKVLMALAMQRMGRNAEAEELLEKVMAEKPTRDDVLHSMAIAFKDMNQSEDDLFSHQKIKVIKNVFF